MWRSGSTLFLLNLVGTGGAIIAAVRLWDDHRGIAWAAIASVLATILMTPVFAGIGMFAGFGFLTYSFTEDATSSILASIAGVGISGVTVSRLRRQRREVGRAAEWQVKKLTITGYLVGRRERSVIEWTGGELSGDTDAIAAIRAEAQRQDGRRLGLIPGIETTTAERHLSAPYSFLQLVGYVLTDLNVEGLPPSAPTHPGFVNAPAERGENR